MKEVNEYLEYAQANPGSFARSTKRCLARVARVRDEALREDGHIVYDPRAVTKVLRFLEHLRHDGEEELRLMPWQKFLIACIYGFRWRNGNRLVFNDVFLYVAKKNGKTALASGLALLSLLTHRAAQIILVATDYSQAKIAYGDIVRYTRGTPALSNELAEGSLFVRELPTPPIEDRRRMSRIEILPETREQAAQGRKPIFALFDEIASYTTSDIIQKVNGEDITGMELGDIVSKIKGPAGSRVTLTVLTPDTEDVRDVTLVRARIPVHSVDWSVVPGSKIAHVRVSAFTKGVANDMKNALKDIQSQNMEGVVLDLRNNPGGLLQEAVDIASEFLDGGDVMQEKDASGNIRSLPVEPGGIAAKIPLIVLVNGGSASASEIVAGALQDSDRARLVGEKTFGTGTVLNQFNLSDGSALLLATEEWLTPSGRVIWHKGIDPDVVVSLPDGANPLNPIREESMPADQVAGSQDTQLFKALEMLGHTVAVENPQPTVTP